MKVVVFPAPFAPIKETISWVSTWSDTCLRTWIFPKKASMFLTLSIALTTTYYQDLEIIYIQTDFHHPLALRRQGLVRDTEHTERHVPLENREVPILQGLPDLRPRQFVPDRSFLSVGHLPDRQKSPLSVTSVSLW